MIDWVPMIQQCAPQVAPATMQAVIRTESGFNPLAININGGGRLARQPQSRREATLWAHWLVSRGYSVDLGLMQINSNNLRRLGLNVSTVFDSCHNLQAGARILADNYSRALRQTGNPNTALLQAISAYNTGNFRNGFRNGYVGKVLKSSAALQSAEQDVPPIVGMREPPRSKVKRTSSASSIDSKDATKVADRRAPEAAYQSGTAVAYHINAEAEERKVSAYASGTEAPGYSVAVIESNRTYLYTAPTAVEGFQVAVR